MIYFLLLSGISSKIYYLYIGRTIVNTYWILTYIFFFVSLQVDCIQEQITKGF